MFLLGAENRRCYEVSMAKQTSASSSKAGFVARLKTFFQEVKVEMGKVTWPTKEDLRSQTTIVLVLLVLLAVIIGVYDKVFEKAIMLILKLG